MNQINNKNDQDTVDMYNPLSFPKPHAQKTGKVEGHAQCRKFVFQMTAYRNQCKAKADSLWELCTETFKLYTVNTYGILNKKEYDNFVGNFDIAIAHLEQQLNSLIDQSTLKMPRNPTGEIRVYSIVQPVSDKIKNYIDCFKKRSTEMKNEIFLFGTQRI
jgi:hypothetical protein